MVYFSVDPGIARGSEMGCEATADGVYVLLQCRLIQEPPGDVRAAREDRCLEPNPNDPRAGSLQISHSEELGSLARQLLRLDVQ